MIDIRNASAEDYEAWLPLWQGYLAFYESEISETATRTTWSRILDPMNVLTARLAEIDGKVIGFAHHHTHLSTWDPRPVAYLEDLFVDPNIRGKGVGRALIDDLVALGREAGWASIYWITQETNKTAQTLYNSYNQPDPFIRYSVTL